MNERIKELADQAEDYATAEYEKWIPTPDFSGIPHIRKIFNEKFAELIVRECADICYHHSNAAGGVDTHFGYGYKDCGDDIKRHFGVER